MENLSSDLWNAVVFTAPIFALWIGIYIADVIRIWKGERND